MYNVLTTQARLDAFLQMELNVSDQLAKIIGTKKGEKISRPQVTAGLFPVSIVTLPSQCVKRLWAYLKEKELQDPENKQWFTPDETMAPIFGDEKIKCFSMSKYLKVRFVKCTSDHAFNSQEHLINPDK